MEAFVIPSATTELRQPPKSIGEPLCPMKHGFAPSAGKVVSDLMNQVPCSRGPHYFTPWVFYPVGSAADERQRWRPRGEAEH